MKILISALILLVIGTACANQSCVVSAVVQGDESEENPYHDFLQKFAFHHHPQREKLLNAFLYLRRVMDQYHRTVGVYYDENSPGNHFVVRAIIYEGGENDESDRCHLKSLETKSCLMVEDTSIGTRAESGSALKITYRPGLLSPVGWAGMILQNGRWDQHERKVKANFGSTPDAGMDLSGAEKLVFWAKGEQGGERVQIFLGGTGWDVENNIRDSSIARYPESLGRCPILHTRRDTITLSKQWRRYEINLQGRELEYLLNGFGLVMIEEDNPAGVTGINGTTVYVDDIEFILGAKAKKQRLASARFLRSYSLPADIEGIDNDEEKKFIITQQQAAHTYDNALVLLAFLADGTEDGLVRAKKIGDAFGYAIQHDRFAENCCLRAAYTAGDIKLPPGWSLADKEPIVRYPVFNSENIARYKPSSNVHCEQKPLIETAQNSLYYEVEGKFDIGNNGWALIALTALYQRTKDINYLESAISISQFIELFRQQLGAYQGYRGGIEGYESHYDNSYHRMKHCLVNRKENGQKICRGEYLWASMEHNLDVYVAYSNLLRIVGDQHPMAATWHSGRRHAKTFIDSAFDKNRGCYLAGTENSERLNITKGQLPLDTQTWSILALQEDRKKQKMVLNCAEVNHCKTFQGFEGCDFNEDKEGIWTEGSAQMVLAYLTLGFPRRAEDLLETIRHVQISAGKEAAGAVPAVINGERIDTGFCFAYFAYPHIGAVAWYLFAEMGFNPYYGFLSH